MGENIRARLGGRALHILLGAAAVACASTAPAAAHHPGGHPEPDAARGVTFAGLVQATDPKCRGLFAGARSGVCTHGPDPAPANRDVRRNPSTAELVAEAERELAAAGQAPDVAGATVGTPTPPADGTGAVVCEGDGRSGRRVEVLYVVPAGQTDRWADAGFQDLLGSYAVRADRQLAQSALQTGGMRHFRFATTTPDALGGCELAITRVAIGSADDDTFDASITAVKAQGFNRADRKYLMLVESTTYCGIGTIYRDSRADQANYNNGTFAQYARADRGCWNYAEAHELMHNLGGVQPDAPDATPGYHCTDEHDEMCYDDDGSGGVSMSYICPSANGTLFDCDHDSYFSTAPAAGTYLATNWNTADSAFLIASAAGPVDTTAPAAPTGVAAAPGAGSATVTWAAGAEPDLAGYRVLRDGVQVASLGKVTSFTDTGLLSTRSYAYAVRAVDTAGNVSGDSATATVTPSPATTTTATSGKFAKNSTTNTVTYAALAGPATVAVTGSTQSKGRTAPANVTVTVRNGATTVGTLTTSGGTLSVTLPADGSYSFTVSGASGTSWTRSVTRRTA